MTGFGTTAFTDPYHYRRNLAGAEVGLVLTGNTAFGAHVSWIDMHRLRLLAIEEQAPRVAFISLPPERLFVSFPLTGNGCLAWNGIGLARGELVLHAPGDRFYQRTTGATRWGLVSVSARDLSGYGRALLDAELCSRTTQFLHPSARSSDDLLRLHAQASRLARKKPHLLARPEVARAIEQDLIHALVTALGTPKPGSLSGPLRRRAAAMVRFEDALADDRAQSLPDLCATIGVSERTLRMYCAQFLGCSPLEYGRLRRLNLARSALLQADHESGSVSEVARNHGFFQPGRFSVAYRALFGETPYGVFRFCIVRFAGSSDVAPGRQQFAPALLSKGAA
jgi:AraC-like DNA-binding protein